MCALIQAEFGPEFDIQSAVPRNGHFIPVSHSLPKKALYLNSSTPQHLQTYIHFLSLGSLVSSTWQEHKALALQAFL